MRLGQWLQQVLSTHPEPFPSRRCHYGNTTPPLHSRYYSGEKKAPVLTIFIGGNHEASNHLQELPYGGWVAPNIYYLGKCFWVMLLFFS